MTQDDVDEELSLMFDTLGDLFYWEGGYGPDDFNEERDSFIQRGIKLINKCIESGGCNGK